MLCENQMNTIDIKSLFFIFIYDAIKLNAHNKIFVGSWIGADSPHQCVLVLLICKSLNRLMWRSNQYYRY